MTKVEENAADTSLAERPVQSRPAGSETDPKAWIALKRYLAATAATMIAGSYTAAAQPVVCRWDLDVVTASEDCNASTVRRRARPSLNNELEELLRPANVAHVEEGSFSDFEQLLQAVVLRHGSAAIDAIQGLLLAGKLDEDVAFDTLRILGQIGDLGTQDDRWWLLTRSLQYSSAKLREGGMLGLSSLDDPRALPYLRVAAARENSRRLQRDLKSVIDQLADTARQWRSSYERS